MALWQNRESDRVSADARATRRDAFGRCVQRQGLGQREPRSTKRAPSWCLFVTCQLRPTERGFERSLWDLTRRARDLGQRPLLPGHAIAGWGFKTSIVMLPVVMLKARATSRISFAMGSLLSQSANVGFACREGLRAFNPERGCGTAH